MATDRHRLALERNHGREEGEAFDRRLREAERAEREERLSRIVLPTLPLDLAEPGRRAPALNELLLRREVERLSHFYDSVQQSRAWRLTQSLRRLVGRAW